MKKNPFILLFFLFSFSGFAQQKALNSSEIYLGLQRLNTLGNAMYIAAHPDDENTLLITWLAKEKKVRTAYFSVTRGDGGQNLIGPEQGEYVGLIRTHELLEARKLDGGEQYFSRAIDFGFSKLTDEAMRIWGKEKILEDMVYRIRKFKPDVLINRFPPDERAGHGHHSASAELSIEAFDAAGDPKRFPEQLKEVDIWKPKRLVWNSFNRGFTNTAPSEKNFIQIPLGEFNSILGESYTEIAAAARSKHRSQGFGSAPTRTERYDYLVHIKGEPAKTDVFDGVDLSWKRVDGGVKIGTALDAVIHNFDFKAPEKSVKDLVAIYNWMLTLPESPYKYEKLEECQELIFACAGVYLEVNSSTNAVSPGQTLKLFTSAVKRGLTPVKVLGLNISGEVKKDTVFNWILENNKNQEAVFDVRIPLTAAISQPYWLHQNKGTGQYVVSEEKFRNLPMAPDALWATFRLEVSGQKMEFKQPIKYKFTEPSRGEIYKYTEIRPEVMLNFEQNVFVFPKGQSKQVGIIVKNNIDANQVSVSLNLPKGWKSSPEVAQVVFDSKNQEKPVYFTVTPGVEDGEIKAVAATERGKFSYAYKHIYYEHIPELNLYPEATAKAINLDINITNNKLGYIMGAGDEVPHALRQVGYNVSLLDANSIKSDLSQFDAIVVGVRAYNTEDWLANAQNVLLEYVKNGGNLVVQYQTQAFYGRVKTSEMGPYPISIGRGRVTDEDAPVKFVDSKAALLSYPNKITEKDFEGWVQERGLYFAEQWSDKYSTILSMKDKGETAQEGSVLYAKYGKGNYVFTGLALFRQLPAGVPGAYRLMANFISAK